MDGMNEWGIGKGLGRVVRIFDRMIAIKVRNFSRVCLQKILQNNVQEAIG